MYSIFHDFLQNIFILLIFNYRQMIQEYLLPQLEDLVMQNL